MVSRLGNLNERKKINVDIIFQENLSTKRAYIITAGGVLLTLGSKVIDYPGAGPLAIMTAAFVAAMCWKKIDSYSVSNNRISSEMQMCGSNLRLIFFHRGALHTVFTRDN